MNKLLRKAGDDLPLVQRREQRPVTGIGKRRPWLEGESVPTAPIDDESMTEVNDESMTELHVKTPAAQASQILVDDNKETTRRQVDDKSMTSRPVVADTSTGSQRHVDDMSMTRQRRVAIKVDDSVDDTIRTPPSLEYLVKTRRSVMDFLFRQACLTGTRSTKIIQASNAAETVGTSISNWKQTTQRLARDGYFSVRGFNGGGSIYTLRESVFEALVRQEVKDRSMTESMTESMTPSSHSSSSLKNSYKTTTTGLRLDPEWEALDLTPLTDLKMRFSKTHVVQLAKVGSLSATELQDSIHMFAFDIRHNRKAESIAGDVVNFFMGILRKGPYLPPQNYRSSEVLQRQAYLEWKRREEDDLKVIDGEIIDMEFKKWWKSLDAETRKNYAPDLVNAREWPQDSPMHLQSVKERFLTSVWPTMQSSQ